MLRKKTNTVVDIEKQSNDLDILAGTTFGLAEAVLKYAIKVAKNTNPDEKCVNYDHVYDKEGKLLGYNFIYERNNKWFHVALPIFVNLLDEIKYSNEPLRTKEKSEDNTRSTFIGLLYKPFVMLFAGISAIVNVINILPLHKVGIIIPAVLGGAIPLYGHILLLFSCIIYFAPIVKQRVNRNFSELIKKAIMDYNLSDYDAAHDKLHNLSIINNIFLYWQLPYFTINNNILSRFYYVRAFLVKRGYKFDQIISSMTLYLEESYKIVEDPELKFFILFELLNIEDDRLEHYKKEYDDPLMNSELLVKEKRICEENIEYCKKRIENLKKEMPNCPVFHRRKCKYFVRELKICVNNLMSNEVERMQAGFNQFLELKLEGYYKHYLPEATIVYYQTYILMVYYEIKPHFRADLWLVNTYMNKIKNYINENFPGKYKEVQQYINEFKKVYSDINHAYNASYTPFVESQKANGRYIPKTLDIENIEESTPLFSKDEKNKIKKSTHKSALSHI